MRKDGALGLAGLDLVLGICFWAAIVDSCVLMSTSCVVDLVIESRRFRDAKIQSSGATSRRGRGRQDEGL
tara:strand:+ start:2247 stop:2456 length:210 start_codon:yes stop_codon:yes gene_type:complete